MKCPSGYKCIPGDGPRDARIMGIFEAPGRTEERTGIALTGPTGMELDHTYLPLAGLSRSEIYVTNTVKHCSSINRKPTLDEITRCSVCSLKIELQEVKPEIVLLCGATACSLIPDIDLEVMHGIPRIGSLFGVDYTVIPLYHPALGLHTTSAMSELLRDWQGIGRFIEDGTWNWPVDSIDRSYNLITQDYTLSDPKAYSGERLIAIDTESHGNKPFSIQFSDYIGMARMVLLDDPVCTNWVVGFINRSIKDGSELVLHNAPADLDLIYNLGIRNFKYRDTMQEAYHLSLPQALKALSYRLLGRRDRLSWDETVSEPSRDKLFEWLDKAFDYSVDRLRVYEKRYGKKGNELKPNMHKSPEEKLFKRIYTHLYSTTYNPWQKLNEGMVELIDSGRNTDHIVHDLGLPPIKGIGNCDINEAINYGCSDADDTLAVAIELERLRGLVGMNIDDGDIDHGNS